MYRSALFFTLLLLTHSFVSCIDSRFSKDSEQIIIERIKSDIPDELFKSNPNSREYISLIIEDSVRVLSLEDVSNERLHLYFDDLEANASCALFFRGSYEKKYDVFEYLPILLSVNKRLPLRFIFLEAQWKQSKGRELGYRSEDGRQLRNSCKAITSLSDNELKDLEANWESTLKVLVSIRKTQ